MNKNYIYSIKGLLIPRQHNKSIVEAGVEEYIKLVPELTDTLRNCLQKNKCDYFINNMETALKLLRSVYARWLATDAEAILRAARLEHMDVCRKNTPSFIAEMLSLSIDMQISQQAAVKEEEVKKSKIEMFTDTAHNLEAIDKLVMLSEFDRACDMLIDMGSLECGNLCRDLNLALKKRNGETAGILIKALRNEFVKKIVALGGSLSGFEHKILAVDDKPEILSFVTGILKEQYKVYGAPSGGVALKVLVAQRIDLFIFDIDMPGMNGFELAHAVRSMNEYMKTPLLFLTSNATKDYVIKAMEAGCNDFIVKPAYREVILAKVGKYLL